jgi:hypothetical protein
VLIVGFIVRDKVIEQKDWVYEDIPHILNFLITGLTIGER